jgi:hypothetical protein
VAAVHGTMGSDSSESGLISPYKGTSGVSQGAWMHFQGPMVAPQRHDIVSQALQPAFVAADCVASILCVRLIKSGLWHCKPDALSIRRFFCLMNNILVNNRRDNTADVPVMQTSTSFAHLCHLALLLAPFTES